MKTYFQYREIAYTISTAWLMVLLISILGTIADMSELVVGVILSGGLTPWVIKKRRELLGRDSTVGKRIFLSSTGYILLGAILGLVILSAIFNIAYDGDLFDFTDFGFALLSLPLSFLLDLKIDNDEISKRVILYFIVAINLTALLYMCDFITFIFTKVLKKIRVINN